MKRTLAIFLAMLMLLGVFALCAGAAGKPELPPAPSGLAQQIMNWLLYLPNLFSPGWADEAAEYLVFFSGLVPPPFNWLIIWFLRAL